MKNIIQKITELADTASRSALAADPEPGLSMSHCEESLRTAARLIRNWADADLVTHHLQSAADHGLAVMARAATASIGRELALGAAHLCGEWTAMQRDLVDQSLAETYQREVEHAASLAQDLVELVGRLWIRYPRDVTEDGCRTAREVQTCLAEASRQLRARGL